MPPTFDPPTDEPAIRRDLRRRGRTFAIAAAALFVFGPTAIPGALPLLGTAVTVTGVRYLWTAWRVSRALGPLSPEAAVERFRQELDRLPTVDPVNEPPTAT